MVRNSNGSIGLNLVKLFITTHLKRKRWLAKCFYNPTRPSKDMDIGFPFAFEWLFDHNRKIYKSNRDIYIILLATLSVCLSSQQIHVLLWSFTGSHPSSHDWTHFSPSLIRLHPVFQPLRRSISSMGRHIISAKLLAFHLKLLNKERAIEKWSFCSQKS